MGLDLKILDNLKTSDVTIANGGGSAHVSSSAAIQGAVNRERGEELEDRLNEYHEFIKIWDGIVVMKTSPAGRAIGAGRAIITGKGPVDYVAFGPGWTVHFDAKSRVNKQGFSISDTHQLEWLQDMHNLGHTAGHLVEWTYHNVCKWHPVDSVDGKRIRFAEGIELDGVSWLEVVSGD